MGNAAIKTMDEDDSASSMTVEAVKVGEALNLADLRGAPVELFVGIVRFDGEEVFRTRRYPSRFMALGQAGRFRVTADDYAMTLDQAREFGRVRMAQRTGR